MARHKRRQKKSKVSERIRDIKKEAFLRAFSKCFNVYTYSGGARGYLGFHICITDLWKLISKGANAHREENRIEVQLPLESYLTNEKEQKERKREWPAG